MLYSKEVATISIQLAKDLNLEWSSSSSAEPPIHFQDCNETQQTRWQWKGQENHDLIRNPLAPCKEVDHRIEEFWIRCRLMFGVQHVALFAVRCRIVLKMLKNVNLNFWGWASHESHIQDVQIRTKVMAYLGCFKKTDYFMTSLMGVKLIPNIFW